MNAIEVKNLSVRYDIVHRKRDSLKESFIAFLKKGRDVHESIWALRNVSFKVKRGECFGVVGENASGKTTLLKAIAGILKPTKGEATARGNLAPLLTLGVGFEPELTAKENVYLYGSLMGLTKDEIDQRYENIVTFSELHNFMDTKLKNFSDGMRMRLGFATAINVDADILLIDEILTVGDGAFQQKCLEKFNDFKKQGKTIVFVSHGLDSVANYCDRAIFLHKGKIREIGQTEHVVKIYERYLKNKELKEYNLNAIRMAHQEDEVKIKDVKLSDKYGKECYLFKTGDAFQTIVRFSSKERPSAFMVTFQGEDGMRLYSKNIERDVVKFNINSLPLLEGRYKFSIVPIGSLAPEKLEFRLEVEEGKENVKDVRLFTGNLPSSLTFLNREVLAFGDGCERVMEDFDNGKTLVLFSNIDKARANCTKGALFHNRKLLFAGRLEEVLKEYEKRIYKETIKKYGKFLNGFVGEKKPTQLPFK